MTRPTKSRSNTPTHPHNQQHQESAETVAELICRNKPPVIADVEPLQKGA
jgi:hypothetical protein